MVEMCSRLFITYTNALISNKKEYVHGNFVVSPYRFGDTLVSVIVATIKKLFIVSYLNSSSQMFIISSQI